MTEIIKRARFIAVIGAAIRILNDRPTTNDPYGKYITAVFGELIEDIATKIGSYTANTRKGRKA